MTTFSFVTNERRSTETTVDNIFKTTQVFEKSGLYNAVEMTTDIGSFSRSKQYYNTNITTNFVTTWFLQNTTTDPSNFTIFGSNYTGISQNISGTNGRFDIIKHLYKQECCDTISDQNKNMCDALSIFFPPLPDKCDIGKPFQSALVSLYVLIIAVSVVGNLLVLLTFIFNKNMRSTTNIFIVSLAGSDMLLIVTTVPFNIGMVLSTHWTLGPFACKLVPFMQTFSIGCSSLTLCCIALDRFYAIIFPFKLQFFQTKYKMVTILSTVWIVSAISGIPQATSYEHVQFESICATITECLFPKDETPFQRFNRLWMSFCILFLIPLLVMAILYGIIIYRLWGKCSYCLTTNVNSSDGLRLRQKKRAIKMLVTVITLFVVCWLPLQVYNIYVEKMHTKDSHTIHTLHLCLQCLAMSSGCYNPIVYAFMNEKFRKSFALFLLCKKRHHRIYPTSDKKQENTSRKVFQLKSEHPVVSGTLESRM